MSFEITNLNYYFMKSIFTAVLAAATLCVTASAQPQPKQSMHDLLEEFSEPSKTYRTAPFMVWNMEVSQYQIDNMLREFREQGCGGVFIHPRPGLSTEYLSQEWFDLVAYTVRRGHEFGLNVWLYDENSYPSGFAGGHVPRTMPESYNQGQGLKPTVVDVMPDDVSAYTVIVSEKKGKLTNITDKAAKMAGKKGKFYLYEKTYYQPSAWMGGTSYVDLLKPGVTQQFMKVTMSGYEKNLEGDLKLNIEGIFTDEPEIVSPGGVRWTPDLFEVFEQTYGYDLSAQLPALHEEVGDWKKVRHDYFALLSRLFVERWAKPWYEYCADKGIVWTGHYWEHMWPTTTGVPDNMAMAAWQQMPGIDMLFNQFDETSPNAQFGNIRSVKEVRSVANQLGRQRVLSETYGGAGWNATFKDFKRLADWQYVLGVNFVNQHLSHMSLLGSRKTDYPPEFSRAATWWSDYHLLNDYNGRMSAAMSMGDQINDILVLEPTTSVWMYNQYVESTPGNQAKRIGQAFQQLVTQLEKAQVEYDLGCEAIMHDHASVKGNRLVVGKRSYGTFVIPALTENLEGKTFSLLQQFAAAGGRIIALGVPTLVNGAYSEEAAHFFASDRVIRAEKCDEALMDTYLRDKTQIDFQQVQGGDLYHHRRQFSDGQLLLLTNASMDEASNVTVTLPGKYVVRMDAMDGKNYEVPSTSTGDRVTVSVRVEPAGSVLLRFSDTPVAAQSVSDPGQLTLLEPMRPMKIERLKENVLLLDFMDLTCGGETYRNVYWTDACDKVFQKAGLPGNPWYRAVQYGREIVDLDLSKAPGFTATYRFTVTDPKVDMASMVMVVENPNLYTVKINGQVVRGGYYFMVDEDFKRITIGPHVKVGENIIEISAEHPTVFTELAAVYVLGHFDVVNRDDRWVIVPEKKDNTLKDWQALGAPFYPWEMRYTEFYDVRHPDKRHILKVDDWNGSLVQVWINDRKAGVIFAEPYALDVTPYVQKGANRVEVRVVGSLQNLMGPHFRPYDGYAGPDRWQNIEPGRKASDYYLTPFGLKSRFAFYEAEH